MRRLFKGKFCLRLRRENPYYGTAYRTLEKVFFYKFGWSLSLWSIHEDNVNSEFNDWAIMKLIKIFPGCTIENNSIVHWEGKLYYPEYHRWMFNRKYELEPTENRCVMFDKKSQRYIGFSHRSAQLFGIGDMLFTADKSKVNKSEYYKIRKYRRKYILTLLRYHILGDSEGFEDLCEDNIIGHGLMCIVPFNQRGIKRIETLDEAYEAASNFAKYVS